MKKLLYCSNNKTIKILTYKLKPKLDIIDIREVYIDELSQFISEKDLISIAFEANIYADRGEFSSASKLASTISIKNHINNLGIFGQRFEVSYKKLRLIDKTKSEFFYVAANREAFDWINNLNCTISQCVPTEIAIKNLFCNYYKNEEKFLVIIKKNDFTKIICFNKTELLATTTIHNEGFDAQNIEVEKAFYSISKQFTINKIYYLQEEAISLDNIQTEKTLINIGNLRSDQIIEHIDLIGLIYKSDINFLTEKHKNRLEAYKHKIMANKIAFVLLFISIMIFGKAFANYINILEEKEQLRISLALFEKNINTIKYSPNLIDTNLQKNIDLYANFQKTPEISTIMANLSQEKLPNLYLLKVNINNAISSNNTQDSNQTLSIPNSYSIDLKGIIFDNLNSAKNSYNNFLSQMLKNYKIDLSNFYYIDNKLFFEIKLETKNEQSE